MEGEKRGREGEKWGREEGEEGAGGGRGEEEREGGGKRKLLRAPLQKGGGRRGGGRGDVRGWEGGEAYPPVHPLKYPEQVAIGYKKLE